VLLGVIVIPALGFIGALGLMGHEEKKRKEAIANAPALLAEAFSGESAVYKTGPDTLPYETVVTGAIARGYKLVSENAEPGNRKTLVFVRS
jgi:hypothetical protein